MSSYHYFSKSFLYLAVFETFEKMLVYIEHPATLCNVLPRIKISISAGCVGPPKTRIVNASFVGHLAGAGVYIALVARDGIGMLLRNQMAPKKTHFGV